MIKYLLPPLAICALMTGCASTKQQQVSSAKTMDCQNLNKKITTTGTPKAKKSTLQAYYVKHCSQ